MAQSYNYYVGNGVKKDYEFTHELNDQATVYGIVDDTETAGTWNSVTGFFTFTTAPANGAKIYVARRTDNNVAVATFPNKSYITSDNLDADFRQSLMQVQELQFDLIRMTALFSSSGDYASQAAASAAAAALSETAAAASAALANSHAISAGVAAQSASDDADQTALDRIATSADAASTAADVITIDEVSTNNAIAFAIALGG